MRTHATRLIAVLGGSLALAASMLAGPAASAETTTEPPAAPELVMDATVEVETFTPGGVLVARETYGMETMGRELEVPGLDRIPAVAAHNGEDVSAYGSGTNTNMKSTTGCGKATVHNRASTLLGFNAWDIDTWTYWCWNNNTSKVYNVDTGWKIHSMDSQYVWRGWLPDSTIKKFFTWRSGYSTSGYRHYRQGHVENCVLKYGCLGNYYPENDIRSRANGTFYWMVNN